jgi:hypothetical protein
MKKVFALLLVSVFAFGMVGCGDDDDAGCTTEAATACSDAYTACATDAGVDLDAANACLDTYCTCLTDLGCDMTGIDCGGDAGV